MKITPCIVGLGYVGLPIALALSKKFFTYGFDINNERIKKLKKKCMKLIVIFCLQIIPIYLIN